MVSIEKKHLTVVSVDYDLDNIALGEKVFIRHDKNNEYDKKALKVYREKEREDLGYVAASKHTIKSGCVSNSDIFPYIPSETVPLVGTAIRKTEVNFRNGSFVPALIVEVTVVNQKSKAV